MLRLSLFETLSSEFASKGIKCYLEKALTEVPCVHLSHFLISGTLSTDPLPRGSVSAPLCSCSGAVSARLGLAPGTKNPTLARRQVGTSSAIDQFVNLALP